MDYYSPDYKLHVPVSNMENENTREQLEMKKQKLFEARDASPRHLPETPPRERAPRTTFRGPLPRTALRRPRYATCPAALPETFPAKSWTRL